MSVMPALFLESVNVEATGLAHQKVTSYLNLTCISACNTTSGSWSMVRNTLLFAAATIAGGYYILCRPCMTPSVCSADRLQDSVTT